jgi:hypothetical protein
MGSAPGFFTVFGKCKPCRQIIELLKNIFNMYFPFKFRIEFFFEGIGKAFPDNKNDLSKSCPYGIENGIINDGFSVWSYRFDLF